MNPTLPTYVLYILQGQRSNAQVLIFVLNSLREAEFFIELYRRPHSLSRDKQYDLVFFLTYNGFLNYKVFTQNGRYSSIQVTLQF